MAKIKNISGEDRFVPALGGRLVLVGAEVDVEPEDVYGFTCQDENWAPADVEAEQAHAEATAEPEDINFETATKAELIAWADEHQVAINPKANKADIIAALTAATNGQEG